MSPIVSQMKTSFELKEIITVKFQVDRVYLNKEFYKDYNQSYKDWFFSCFSKEMQQLFKTIYYKHLAKIKENVTFFNWLNHYLKDTKFSIFMKDH